MSWRYLWMNLSFFALRLFIVCITWVGSVGVWSKERGIKWKEMSLHGPTRNCIGTPCLIGRYWNRLSQECHCWKVSSKKWQKYSNFRWACGILYKIHQGLLKDNHTRVFISWEGYPVHFDEVYLVALKTTKEKLILTPIVVLPNSSDPFIMQVNI